MLSFDTNFPGLNLAQLTNEHWICRSLLVLFPYIRVCTGVDWWPSKASKCMLYVGAVPDLRWGCGVCKHTYWCGAEQAAGGWSAPCSVTGWFDVVVISDIPVWCFLGWEVAPYRASHSQFRQRDCLYDRMWVWWCWLLVTGRWRHYSGESIVLWHFSLDASVSAYWLGIYLVQLATSFRLAKSI